MSVTPGRTGVIKAFACTPYTGTLLQNCLFPIQQIIGDFFSELELRPFHLFQILRILIIAVELWLKLIFVFRKRQKHFSDRMIHFPKGQFIHQQEFALSNSLFVSRLPRKAMIPPRIYPSSQWEKLLP